MRHFFLLSAIAMVFASCVTQKYDRVRFPSPFSLEIIDSAHGTKNELFARASDWVIKSFVNSKDAIQLSDKEEGKIIAKGFMASIEKGLATTTYYLQFSLSVSVKNGKYKMSISDFIVVKSASAGNNGNIIRTYGNPSLDESKTPHDIWRKTWINIKGDCWKNAHTIQNDFIKAMKANADNW